jgi:hypothetical protein
MFLLVQASATAGKIWTVNARENFALDSVKEYFGMTNQQLHYQILALHEETVRLLKSKGVAYGGLRNALTPSRDKREAAFLFDSASPELGSFYGASAGDLLLAALPKEKRFSTSILSGDLFIDNQDLGFMLLELGLVQASGLSKIRHTSQIYGVYLNNLSDGRLAAIDGGLRSSPAYIGHVDCTYSSLVKTWLSTTLVHRYVKSGRIFLSAHEPDVPNSENYNHPGWSLDDYGFECASFQDTYFDILLSYKIERQPAPGDSDIQHALTAISESPLDLSTFEVQMDDRKLKYIEEHAGGGYHAAGLGSSTREEVVEAIRSRIASNYIYDLELLLHADGSTAKFTTMLEFPRKGASPIRMQVTIAYVPEPRVLRVITMF